MTGDTGIEKLVNNNVVKAERTLNDSRVITKKKTTKISEIINSHTVCTKPMMGG